MTGWTRPLRILVAAELALILVAGAVTVFRFPLWSEIDEAQHYAYIENLAEGDGLPLLHDRVGADVSQISRHIYPGPSPFGAVGVGLQGLQYEAFQPPLYYAVAVPAYWIGGGGRGHVRAVRAFNLVLLLLAAGVLWPLARRALGELGPLGFSVGLAVLAWPGVVVRAVTVSPTALEILVTLLFLLVAYKADEDLDRRALAGAAVLLGLAFLTKTTLLLLAPVYAVVVARHLLRRPEGRFLAGVLALAIPVVLAVPWLAWNVDHYHALLATSQARDLQQPILNPRRVDFGPLTVLNRAPKMAGGMNPQESLARPASPGVVLVEAVLGVLVFGAALAFVFVADRAGDRRRLLLLGAPWVVGVVMAAAILLGANWDIFLPRYLYPALPGLALLAALAWTRLVRQPRAPLALAFVLAGGAAFLWFDLSMLVYFNGLGRHLGFTG